MNNQRIITEKEVDSLEQENAALREQINLLRAKYNSLEIKIETSSKYIFMLESIFLKALRGG